MSQEPLPDREMIAASETAKRNPMRPPDTSPTTAAAALRVFARHPSPALIALFVAILAAWRVAYGNFGWADALLRNGRHAARSLAELRLRHGRITEADVLSQRPREQQHVLRDDDHASAQLAGGHVPDVDAAHEDGRVEVAVHRDVVAVHGDPLLPGHDGGDHLHAAGERGQDVRQGAGVLVLATEVGVGIGADQVTRAEDVDVLPDAGAGAVD